MRRPTQFLVTTVLAAKLLASALLIGHAYARPTGRDLRESSLWDECSFERAELPEGMENSIYSNDFNAICIGNLSTGERATARYSIMDGRDGEARNILLVYRDAQSRGFIFVENNYVYDKVMDSGFIDRNGVIIRSEEAIFQELTDKNLRGLVSILERETTALEAGLMMNLFESIFND